MQIAYPISLYGPDLDPARDPYAVPDCRKFIVLILSWGVLPASRLVFRCVLRAPFRAQCFSVFRVGCGQRCISLQSGSRCPFCIPSACLRGGGGGARPFQRKTISSRFHVTMRCWGCYVAEPCNQADAST